MAKKIRSSMSLSQMHDFAAGSMKGKPAHVAAKGGSHPHRNLGKYLHAKKG
jgi:hypothetical protein